MGFQKCPICNGTGIKPGSHSHNCKTCVGTGMVNEFTGLPAPQHAGENTNLGNQPQKIHPGFNQKSSGDFRDDDNRESQSEWLGRS